MRRCVVAAALMLLCSSGAAAQQPSVDLQERQVAPQVEKLEREINALKRAENPLRSWLPVVIGLVAGVIGAAGSLVVARRTRLGGLDQSVHDAQLEAYPRLVEATAPLALYFPGQPSIRPSDCRQMGRSMSDWYFRNGGLLLSSKARDAYFRLMRALTRASLADELRAPVFPRDADLIDERQLDCYRSQLQPHNLDDVEGWTFGESLTGDTPSERFRDFVMLQGLSSALRTSLAADVRSRRLPAS